MALAVGAGYLLGRTHKTKLALGLAAAAATGKAGGVSGQLLKRGTKLVGSSDALGKLSPELTQVTDMIRGDLVDVGKAAALSAVRGRIDRLSSSLQERADVIRDGGRLLGDEDEDEPRRGGGERRRRRRAEDDEEPTDRAEDDEEPADYEEAEDAEDVEDVDEAPGDEDEEPEPEEERPVRRRRTAASGTRRPRSSAGDAAASGTRRARSAAGSAAGRRSGR